MSENNSWLGRWFVIKTFDNEDDCIVAEIWAILNESDDKSDESHACSCRATNRLRELVEIEPL